MFTLCDGKNDEKSVEEERKTFMEDASTLRELEASSSVSFKPECDSQVHSDRDHIIMQNFARVIWNVLKQYNSKLKVAEMEIASLKEIIGYENKRYLELQTQLNEFKETFHAQKSCDPRVDQSDEEDSMLCTPCSHFDSEHSDSACDADAVGKILSEVLHIESSSEPRLDPSDEEPVHVISCTKLDSEKFDRTPMPLSSMFTRDLSTFDLSDESEKLKGNQGTRKFPAQNPEGSNGIISLLHLLQEQETKAWSAPPRMVTCWSTCWHQSREELNETGTNSNAVLDEYEEIPVSLEPSLDNAVVMQKARRARRVPKRWSSQEEASLKEGVQKFGVGNWAVIRDLYSDIFEGRTAVDLKDKWRNMERRG